jgi:uncharacterized UPF0160 family protein
MKTLIELIKSGNEHGFYTHCGIPHFDETAGWIVLQEWGADPDKLQRVPKSFKIPKDGVAFDTHFTEFDHHQAGGVPTYEDGVKYASLGRLVSTYMVEALTLAGKSKRVAEEATKGFMDHFVTFMDHTDNEGPVKYPNTLTYMFNALRDTHENPSSDETFNELVSAMYQFVESAITKEVADAEERETAANLAEGKEWVDCTEGKYFKAALFKGTTVKFVLGNDIQTPGNFNVTAVDSVASPVIAVAGEGDCTFIHAGKFIASFKTKEAAITAINNSLKITE